MTEPTPLVNTVESRRSVGRAIPATTTGGRPGVRVDAVRQLLPVLRPIADMSAAMNALADDDRPAPAGTAPLFHHDKCYIQYFTLKVDN